MNATPLTSFLSWFRRRVVVEAAHPDYLTDTRIVIDGADGSTPQEMLLARNNLCSLAWVCERFHTDEKGKGPIKKVRLTVTIPKGSLRRDGSVFEKDEEETLNVPDWAKYKLYAAVRERALALGWKGEVYHPTPTSWERLFEEDGL